MPAAPSASGSASSLYCGFRRERGTVRTSTTSATSAAASSAKNSGNSRVEWPTVKNGVLTAAGLSPARVDSAIQLALVEILECGLRGRGEVAVGEAVPGLRHGEKHCPRRLVVSALGELQAGLGKPSIAVV